MNNTQEITIDNLAETLEYNGWDKKDSAYSYSYIFGLDNIYWDINGLIHVTRQRGIYIWVDNKLINIIVEHFKLKPSPAKPANLWGWCLDNGWYSSLNKDHEECLRFNEESWLRIDKNKETNDIYIYHNYKFWEVTDLSLDKQINLLNAFMEAYNENS